MAQVGVLSLALTLPALGDFSRLETFLARDSLFETTPDTFLAEPDDRPFFKWLSPERDEARYPGYANSPAMTFLGNKCWETRVRFLNGKLAEVSLSLYNRGDAGDINSEKMFDAMCAGIATNIGIWASDRGSPLPPVRLGNGMRVDGKAWVRDNALAIEMKWSASENIKAAAPVPPAVVSRIRFRAEYVLVTFSKYDPRHDPRKTPTTLSPPKAPEQATARDIKANVSREPDGSVCIEHIPMVDQGQKGYCAVATAERLLRYYGTDVDQNTLAQMANTSTTFGTNPGQLIDTLRRLGGRFGVRVKVQREFSIQEFQEFVEDYNRAARRARKGQIVLGSVIDINRVYHDMDYEILKRTRCDRARTDYKRFCADIVSHVDLGIPLAWSVVLGKVPETPALRQSGGGHMRVIQGYNKTLDTVIYSDSWGAGHERKSMSMEDAWAITTGLYSFDPRR